MKTVSELRFWTVLFLCVVALIWVSTIFLLFLRADSFECVGLVCTITKSGVSGVPFCELFVLNDTIIYY